MLPQTLVTRTLPFFEKQLLAANQQVHLAATTTQESSLMEEERNSLPPSRLSRIETLWSVVCEAHAGGDGRRQPAQELLMQRYGPAIKQYLVASLKNVEQAEELFQEFALKFIKGDLRQASPEKGKFRAYVKTVLANLIRTHQKRLLRLRKLGEGNELDVAEPASSLEDEERQTQLFVATWREDLMARTWNAFSVESKKSNSPNYQALRYRVEHPAENYEQLSMALTKLIGREVKPGNARIMIHRARNRFARLLIDQVADSQVICFSDR